MPRPPGGSTAHCSASRAVRSSSRSAASRSGPARSSADLRHLLARLQVALRGPPVDVPHVERHQPPCRIEHVGGGRVEGVDVPDRVAQHHRHVLSRRRTGASPAPATGRRGRGGARPRAPAGRGRTPRARRPGARRRDRRARRPGPGPPGSRGRAARSGRSRAPRPSAASSPVHPACRADGWRWSAGTATASRRRPWRGR